MGVYVCFLVVVLQPSRQGFASSLLRTAIKIHRDDLPSDVVEFPMELDSRRILHDFLPLHAQGEIVEVTTDLFEVHIADRKTS